MKNIRPLSLLLNNYLLSPNIGALIIDSQNDLRDLSHTLPEGPCGSDEPTTISSKDCFFLIDRLQYESQGANTRFLTANGISSLTYADDSIEAIIQSSGNQERNVICVTTCHGLSNSLTNLSILYDKFIFVDKSITLESIYSSRKSLILRRVQRGLSVPISEIRPSILLIDPSLKQLYPLLPAALYLLNPSNIVIGTRDIAKFSAERYFPLSRPLMLSDEQATLPATRKHYTQSQNMLHNGTVSAIINLYRRPEAVLRIYESLIRQSHPVSFIYIWVNGSGEDLLISQLRKKMPRAIFVISDENHGVWARFAFGLNMHSEFCVVFDDDTVPGTRWIENCMTTFHETPSLIGTVGLIYNSSCHYMDHIRIGWPSQNTTTTRVDIVGHSWFFKTEWLKDYWSKAESLAGTDFCGEDMHFSFALQQQGIPTVVPPHPAESIQLWGSIDGARQGSGEEAISISGKGSHMDIPLQRLVSRGFKLLHEEC